MALTKPAGCFLQVAALPLLAGGCTAMFSDSILLGVLLVGAGAVLVLIGGTAARKK